MTRGDARDLSGDIASLAHQAESAGAFERGLLDVLGRAVGFDLAFVWKPSSLTLTGLEDERSRAGLTAPRFAERVSIGRPTYAAELAPIVNAATSAAGVAVDTEVLGASAARECSYHRELVSPLGGKHSLLAVAEVRGRRSALIVLGRTGKVFRSGEVAVVERLLPTMSLALDSFARPAVGAVHAPSLTPRERDVLRYLCLGYTNREIALACGSSPNTVRNQLARVFARLGATTRAEAVGIALGGVGQ